MPPSFNDRLSRGLLLSDGAMGTQFYALGGREVGPCLDALSLSQPELVRGIHLDYIRAGAELIETNTFGANAIRLAAHGLADRVADINRAGVAIAQEARRLTGQDLWVAGAIGPLGQDGGRFGVLRSGSAREVFAEQAAALAEAEADLIILETFTALAEMEEAIAGVRSVTELPVVAQMSFNEDSRTSGGDTPEEVVAVLEALGIAALGANCGVGPEPLLQVMERMAQVAHTPLVAQPNAGFPTYNGGRLVYLSTPDYMAERARLFGDIGVAVVGGCCGTTPEHTSAMRDAIQQVKPRPGRTRRPSVLAKERTPVPEAPAPPTGLAQRLQRGEFVVTMEVDPPRGFDISTTLDSLRGVTGSVHAINVADSPLGQGRMSALATCSLLQSRLGVETIVHVTTRHRNLVAIHSDLLGAHALGVRDVLVVMGDAPRTGDYPGATAVADISASGLVKLISAFNQGVDGSGKPIERPTSFFVGCAFNLSAPDLDRELRVLERKVKAGAHFLLTQPVYDPEVVERVGRRLGGFPLPLLMGILPLRSVRHAQFLHNEVPGISVPPELIQRLENAGTEAADTGLAISRELLQAVHSRVAGAYFIPPYARYQVVSETLEGLDIPGLHSGA
jgi:methionine synthase I (cobalamin-dependent)/5,10-methylenetetrahydrofolate reductase